MNERSIFANTDEKATADYDLANNWEKRSDAARPRVSGKPPMPEQIARAGAFGGS